MSNSIPYFSVGIPTFNRADTFLKETIDAVLAQSFEDFELIISDNQSSDNTPELVKSYNDSRIRFVQHKERLHHGIHFNDIVQNSIGKFFVLNQDDDILHKDFLKRCYEATIGRDDIVMYGAPLWREKPNRGYESRLMRHPTGYNANNFINDEPVYLDGSHIAVKLLDPIYFYLHPAIALRNETLKDTGGYFFDGHGSLDLMTEARVLLNGKFAYDPRVGAIMRTHADNYSRNLKRSDRKIFFRSTFEDLIKIYEKYNIDWQPILEHELETYSQSDLFEAFKEWTYYVAPIALQKIGWNALNKKWSKSKVSLYKKLISKIGLKNLVRFILTNNDG